MKKLYFLIAICIFAGNVLAQQIPVDNQYLVNKFSLNPAYAGFTNNFEAFVSYRNSWLGIPGAPLTKDININGPIMSNMGIGCGITSESAGIFNSLSATANYAYRIKLSEHQAITFGAYAGLFENHINLVADDAQAANDPIVAQNQALQGSVFDAGLGILFRWDRLNAGVVIPRLIESSIINEEANNSTVYTLKRHLKFHASYRYDITPDIQVEPIVVVGKTVTSPLFYEASLLCSYKQLAWLGMTYRKTGMGVSIGANYNRFAMNYTYGFSGSGIISYSSGSHEFTLGLLIGKNNETEMRPSVFKSDNVQPYQNWVE